MNNQPTTVSFDVGGKLEGVLAPRQCIIADCFPPHFRDPSLPPLWAYLLHGGSYTRRYWDLQVPGYPEDSYSFARYLAAHGIGVVAIDHPGCGESHWDCSGEQLSFEVVASANALAVRQLRQRIVRGDLVEGLDAAPGVCIIGMGHSMGGAIGCVMQGGWQSFEALAMMGWLVQPEIGLSIDMEEIFAGMSIEEGYADMASTRVRKGFRPIFYASDVPQVVIDEDERHASRVPLALLSALMAPGLTEVYSEQINVPVYLLYGSEGEATRTPELESALFPHAASVRLHVQPGSAHCHLLSSARQAVAARILRWLWEVAALPSSAPDLYGGSHRSLGLPQ